MRGSPKLSSGSSVIRKNYPGAASSAFPSHFKDFGPYSIGGTPINELDVVSSVILASLASSFSDGSHFSSLADLISFLSLFFLLFFSVDFDTTAVFPMSHI
jgi:hypothetical protein